MFHSIVQDFDPRYWSRSATAVVLVTGFGSAIGTGWLVYELASRISWFLLQWLLHLLFPPGVTLALLPAPPVAYAVQEVAFDRAVSQTVELDLGDPAEDSYVDLGDAMIDDLDVAAPPLPGERVDDLFASDRALLADLERNVGVLAILGTASEGGALADVFGDSSGLGDLDNALGGLVGTEIGVAVGAGGLGVRGSGGSGGTGLATLRGSGLGGGGTAEGLGGLGTKGMGGGRYGTVGKSASRGSVRLGSSTQHGALDSEAIRQVIRRHTNQIRYCYERELQKNPNLAGKIVIRFEIEPNGNVGDVSAESNSLGNDAVATCIVGRFKRMRFPSASEKSTVTYPFVFEVQ